MIQGVTTQAQLLANLQAKLAGLRDAMVQANNVVSYVNKLTAADLVSLGFDTTAAANILEVCGNVAKLIAGAEGGLPAPQLNYVDDAVALVGPQ